MLVHPFIQLFLLLLKQGGVMVKFGTFLIEISIRHLSCMLEFLQNFACRFGLLLLEEVILEKMRKVVLVYLCVIPVVELGGYCLGPS